MSATTFTFILVWEHSHYVLFIQGLALFLLDSFDLVPSRKVLTYCPPKLLGYYLILKTYMLTSVFMVVIDDTFAEGNFGRIKCHSIQSIGYRLSASLFCLSV